MLLNAATHGILRLCGIDPNAAEDEVTEDDIRMMVDIGGENGAIEEAEKEMIENIFEFNNSTAEEVMTHRTDVTSIWVDDTEDEILRTICDSGLSRFPVYNETWMISSASSTRATSCSTPSPTTRNPCAPCCARHTSCRKQCRLTSSSATCR